MRFKFIDALEEQFLLHSNKEDAMKMKATMKNKFDFIGIRAQLRSRILKYLYPEFATEIEENLIEIVYQLYEMEHREYQYVAIELIKKNIELIYKVEYVPFLRKLTEMKPWWDTIDNFAKDILGKYLLHFPEMTDMIINLTVNSNYVWKIRSALLFQINFKEKTNGQILLKAVKKFKNHPDHFVQNAICWSLNEYSKYEPEIVNEFIKKNDLSEDKKLCLNCVESKKEELQH